MVVMDRSAEHPDESGASASEEPAAMCSGERHIRVLAAGAGFKTLRGLARAAGIDRHGIVYWARGVTVPRRAPLARLAVALRVDVAVLGAIFDEARAERQRSADK